MEILNKVDRTNLNSLLVNKDQNKMGEEMISFAEDLPEIKTALDLCILDEKYYSELTYDKNTIKFDVTSSRIFERKTYNGCSDRGISIAPILRYKGVPTIYVESAKLRWIENMDSPLMEGHIWLEVCLDEKWYLYDPTKHLIYLDYDPDNYSLPDNYYAFAKGLNSWQLGVRSISDEKALAKKILKNFDINEYKDPNYEVISIKTKQQKL